MGRQETLATSLFACALFLAGAPDAASHFVTSRLCARPAHPDCTLHNFTVPDVMETRNVSLSEYAGRPVLVVNVATYWGYTWHYHQLNALKATYGDRGLEVLAFPCHQFGKEEPGGNGEELLNGIRYVRPGRGFVPDFPLFKKVEVNGANEHPLFDFLKRLCPPTREEFREQGKLFYTPMNNRDIRWNFEKFLVDGTGMPVARYDQSVQPNDIATDIEALLPSTDSS